MGVSCILIVFLMFGATAAQPQSPNLLPNMPNMRPAANPARPALVPGPARPGSVPIRPVPLPAAPVPGTNTRTRSNQPSAAAMNCITMGRDVVMRCFQTNGGFQMQYVVAILSNGTQGTLPRNAAQITTNMCASQGVVIACIFSGISNLRNTQQCPTVPEYIRLEQETVNLISNFQQLCGNGPLPVPDVCHRRLFQKLRQCYSQAGLNPDMFSPNNTAITRVAGPSHLIGAVIGSDPKTAGKFCSVKNQLFRCMRQTVEKCPGAMELLSLSGYDQEALKKGIDVLCHDVDVYVDGMQCFQKRSPEVMRCYNNLLEKVTDLTADQMRLNLPMAQYNSRYCQLRIQHMDCDLSAWKQRCGKDAVGLKNEFECNLLPVTCKNDRNIQRRLQQTCAIERFERHLRSGAPGRLSIASMTMAFITISTVIFLL